MRATGLTWLAVEGRAPQEIRDIAGHTQTSMTDRYMRAAGILRGGRFGAVFPTLPAELSSSGPECFDMSTIAEEPCEADDEDPAFSEPLLLAFGDNSAQFRSASNPVSHPRLLHRTRPRHSGRVRQMRLRARDGVHRVIVYRRRMHAARLSPIESDALLAFASGVRGRFGDRVRALALFGSRARGEGHEDSDLDVLVLVAGMTRGERRAIQDAAYDAGEAHHVVLSPLAADSDAWRGDLPIAREIARDGVAL
jgi:hypothetical protein